MRFHEIGDQVTYTEQIQRDDDAAVVLVNIFTMASADVDRFRAVWAEDAAYMKQQPGFISAQLHRGTAGSGTFISVATWESSAALGAAFRSPQFQEAVERYPDSVVAMPHVFTKVAVPGICVA